MPVPTSLTRPQQSHLLELEKFHCEVFVRGYDLRNYIVVRRTDRRDTQTYAIRPDGSGTDVMDPVLEFTIEDLYEFPNDQYHLLLRLTGVDESPDATY